MVYKDVIMVYKEAIYHDYPMGIFERNRSTSEADFRALQLRTFFFKHSQSTSSSVSQIRKLDEKPINRNTIQSYVIWEIERHGEKISRMMLTCSGYRSKDISVMVDNIDTNITQSQLVRPVFQYKNDLDGIKMMIIWRSLIDHDSNTSVSCIRLSAASVPKSKYFRGEVLFDEIELARPLRGKCLIRVSIEVSPLVGALTRSYFEAFEHLARFEVVRNFLKTAK